MKKYPKSIRCSTGRTSLQKSIDELSSKLDEIRRNSDSFNDSQVELINDELDKVNRQLRLDLKLIEDGSRITSASEPDATYVNKKNPNKFIETKKYKDGHRVARQYMKWDTPDGEVKNYTGAKDAKRGRYHRTNKDTLDSMLEDYDEVTSATQGLDPENEFIDMSEVENAVDAYIQICEAYPEYSEDGGLAAHVFYDGGTANFFQVGPNQWQIGIMNEDEYNPETYIYENDPYWCTDELMPGEMNDIILTAEECYHELKKLPGVDLNNLYGMRAVLDDWSDVFDYFR